MILKLGMQHWGLKLYKVYIKDDDQIWLPMRLNGKNCNKVIKWEKLAGNDQMNRREKNDPRGVVCNCPGAIYM